MPSRKDKRSPSPKRKGDPPEKKGGVPPKNEKPLAVPKLGSNGAEVAKQPRTKQNMFLAAMAGVVNQSRPAGQKLTGAGAVGQAEVKAALKTLAKENQKVNDRNAEDALATKAALRKEFADKLGSTDPGDIRIAFSAWKHVTQGQNFDQDTYDACLALNIGVDDKQGRAAELQIWVQNQRPEDFSVTEAEDAKLNFSIDLPPADPQKKTTAHVAGFMRRDTGKFMVTHMGPGAIF